MTESEIMKALEICCNSTCSECEFGKQCNGYTTVNLALDLLNRKNAEIERLTKDRYLWTEDGKIELLPRTDLDQIRAEVIQLFVRRLKAHSRKMQSSDWCGEFWDRAVLVTDIDQIAKEMGCGE
jgi:hypothetical protein